MSKSIKLENNTYFDGEICDIGTNENGTYIKWANGLMLQFGIVTLTASQNRSAGGLIYYSGDITLTFPKPFINGIYYGFTNIQIANMNYFCQSYFANTSNSETNIAFVSTGKNETRNIHWFAIGFWK